MNVTIGFGEAAEQDVVDLLDYLLPRAGERVARAYVDGLMEYCADFETFPGRGLRRDDLSPGCALSVITERPPLRFASRVERDNPAHSSWRQEC